MVTCPHCKKPVTFLYQVSPFPDFIKKMTRPRGTCICDHCQQLFRMSTTSQVFLVLMLFVYLGLFYFASNYIPEVMQLGRSEKQAAAALVVIGSLAVGYIHWLFIAQSRPT
jgi:hypothetical protein